MDGRRQHIPDIRLEDENFNPLKVEVVPLSDYKRRVILNPKSRKHVRLYSVGTTNHLFNVIEGGISQYYMDNNVPISEHIAVGRGRPPTEPKNYIDNGYLGLTVRKLLPGGVTSYAPYDGQRMRKWQTLEKVPDPDYIDRVLTIQHRWFDAWIVCTIYAKTDERADNLVAWFEDFMDSYGFYMNHSGVDQYWYEEREEDSYWELHSVPTSISVRPIVYYVRLVKTRVLSCAKLTSVNLDVHVSNDHGQMKVIDTPDGSHTSLFKQLGDIR